MDSEDVYVNLPSHPSLTRDNKPDVDNWFGVEDARKRKQIQDRLAQRARRKSSFCPVV